MPAAPPAITDRLIVWTGNGDPVITSVRTSAATLARTDSAEMPRTTGELHPLMTPIVRAARWGGKEAIPGPRPRITLRDSAANRLSRHGRLGNGQQ